MTQLRKYINIMAVFLLCNYLLIISFFPSNYSILKTTFIFILIINYVWFSFFPAIKTGKKRLDMLYGGYILLLTAFILILLEFVLYITLYHNNMIIYNGNVLTTLNILVFAILIWGLLVNGFFRAVILSKHLRIVWRVLLLIAWWVPIFNIFLFFKVLRKIKKEYLFESKRLDIQEIHAKNQDCKTKYPIVMVHGIFFRDWQFLGYWGRIPAALETCGAKIYYGEQQSSLPIAKSGLELRENLLAILEESGSEKLNIIAHSKGGLDSRYAISHLEISDKIASLTTINTPHRGCVFVAHLLDFIPDKIVNWIGRRYNSVFIKLGDTNPDFVGGAVDLRHDTLRKFNENTPDMPNVHYQSIMSTMRKSRHASFPLNITWWMSKLYDKELNDGLVSVSSAKWGHFLEHITVKGKRGISHADMIDLMREDIHEFDVREFYINLVKDLKSKGF